LTEFSLCSTIIVKPVLFESKYLLWTGVVISSQASITPAREWLVAMRTLLASQPWTAQCFHSIACDILHFEL